MKDERIFYARPDGMHFHMKRDCMMLGDFEKLGYKQITIEELRKRKLHPCSCVNQYLTEKYDIRAEFRRGKVSMLIELHEIMGR